MDFREEEMLEPYLDLTAEETARLVLCLLVEEEITRRLAAYRLPGSGEWAADGEPDTVPPVSPAAAL
jgi:hypothetical protein